VRIQYGEWRPDTPDLDNALTEALNAFPYDTHYRPFNGTAEISDALPAEPLAAIATAEVENISETYAATLDTIYQLTSGGWVDVTGPAVVTDDPMVWDFAQFDRYVLVVSYNNLMRYREVGAVVDFAEITDSPKARVVAAVRDFVMCGDINDPTDGEVPYRVRWGAIGDPLTWPLPGTASAVALQADENDLKAENGKVMAILGSDAGMIFQERAITRASYVGAPLVFRFDLMDGSRGLRARNAAVQFGRVVYFLAKDGFFANDGSGDSTPIGNGKVDRWFNENAAVSRIDYVQAVAFPDLKCVAWMFSASELTFNDHALLFNYTTGRWTHAEVNTVLALTGRTRSYTLEELDAFGTLETLPASLDSEVWQGGAGFPAVITQNYKLASFDGTALEAMLETGSFGLDGRRTFVNGIRPLIQGGTAQITLGTQKTLDEAVTWGTEMATTTATGKADFRSSAFFHRVRARVPSGFTKAVGIDALVNQDDGER
jgi:hypothetical protein